MAGTQEIKQVYDTDTMLQTLHHLMPFAQSIGALAQERAATEGDHSKAKAYINSRASALVGSRVAELVFIAATKIGVAIDEQYIARVGNWALKPYIDDTFKPGTPIACMAGTAAYNARGQISEEIEDKGLRVWSEPVEDVAFRAGAMSLRFLESLGAEIDPEQLLVALDEDDDDFVVVTGRLTERKAVTEASKARDQDDKMMPIMEMLALQSTKES